MVDSLTGLETHAAFEGLVLAEGQVAIAFDVAGLIWVNDQLGHAQGDRTLAALAGTLSELVTEHGGRLFRYAGDEFLWLLEGPAQDSAPQLAEVALRRVAGLRLPYRAANATRDRVLLNAALFMLRPGDLDDVAVFRERVANCIYAAKKRESRDSNLVAVESTTPG